MSMSFLPVVPCASKCSVSKSGTTSKNSVFLCGAPAVTGAWAKVRKIGESGKDGGLYSSQSLPGAGGILAGNTVRATGKTEVASVRPVAATVLHTVRPVFCDEAAGQVSLFPKKAVTLCRRFRRGRVGTVRRGRRCHNPASALQNRRSDEAILPLFLLRRHSVSRLAGAAERRQCATTCERGTQHVVASPG